MKKIYIYNPNQAKFYIAEKCNVIGTGIHSETKKVYWIFDREKITDAYEKWCNNKR